MYTPVYGNSALHRHSKDTLLPLRQGKGTLIRVGETWNNETRLTIKVQGVITNEIEKWENERQVWKEYFWIPIICILRVRTMRGVSIDIKTFRLGKGYLFCIWKPYVIHTGLPELRRQYQQASITARSGAVWESRIRHSSREPHEILTEIIL